MALTDLTKGFKSILKRADTPAEFEKWLKQRRNCRSGTIFCLGGWTSRVLLFLVSTVSSNGKRGSLVELHDKRDRQFTANE